MSVDTGLRVAAVLLLVNGLGFGLPCLYGMWTLATGRGVAMVMGFPSYGHGPFERMGIPSTVPLLAGFLLVCALEVVAGVLVWNGRTAGAVLSLVLLPFGAAYWYGFALPFGPVFALARTVLIAMRWRQLA